MIAVVGSVLLAVYVFLPDFLFRNLAFNFRDITKSSKGRFEEIFSGAGASLLPFLVVLIASQFSWLVGHWPFPVDGSVAQKHSDYRTLITTLCNDAYFHDHIGAAWESVGRILRHQSRFLFWMYSALALEIGSTIVLTYYFGSLSRYRVYRWTFGQLFLRRASHWEVLLTGFAFPRASRPRIRVDVMTTDDHLYTGAVGDFFLKSDGELSGLLLKDFRRFRRDHFETDRKAGHKPDSAKYWRDIPGANFYLPADKIANLNIRYETPPHELLVDIERLIKSLNLGESVTVSLEPKGGAPNGREES